MALVVAVAVLISAATTLPEIRNLRVQQLLERDAQGIGASPSLSWDFQLPNNAGADVDASFSVASYTIFADTSKVLVTAAISEVLKSNAAPTGTKDRPIFTLHQNVELSQQQNIFSMRMPASVALQSSARYSWAVCAEWVVHGDTHGDNASRWTCSRLHSFVTGVIPTSIDGSEWSAVWVGGNTSTTPTPCNHCLASYHAWCHEEKAPPCMFRGVKLRGPDQQLLPKPIASAVLHATGVGMFAMRLNGMPVTDARMEPGE